MDHGRSARSSRWPGTAGRAGGWAGTIPHNTYLYVHQSHFTDFTGVLEQSSFRCPYAQEFAFYFPATYVMFRPFVWLGERPSLWLYLIVTLLGTILMQRYVLRSHRRRSGAAHRRPRCC